MKMDADYARLSWRVGLFAAAADAALGTPYFVPRIRAHAWELTEDRLTEWKAEAISMGVPAAELDQSRS